MNRKERMTKKKQQRQRVFLATGITVCVMAGTFAVYSLTNNDAKTPTTQSKTTETTQIKKETQKTSTITIMASGDMLYHDGVYGSAFDGEKYDFANDYEQITPLISSADLALGDFEGTINPNRELAGYPIFNAPEAVVESIKNAGYDAIDLAHNHILDTGIEGLVYTYDAFKKAGMDPFGVKTTDKDEILVKKVNGIKVAILGYSYGFNGIEATLSKEDYDYYLKDLTMEKVEAEIKQAEKIADLTVVMPQSGVEYNLEPTEEQQTTYRQMVDWGADIVFGGHPHVVEPTETITKDGEKKFIIYSMGNLLSNQRYETLENYWTERGVIMAVDVQKTGDKTVLTKVEAHPTWVSREPINRTFSGYQAYDYQVFLAEDYLPGGKYTDQMSTEKQQRIEQGYHEVMDLLNIQF
ncbi:CapA family protein [Enterococcus italicus]|uniref:CapA family protein n=1 Tax=Enterococcus italicus TaxID=246144 RepID=UPI003F487FDE